MYYPIEGGSVECIQGYECQLPPVGYGKNRLTGELEYIGIISSSSKPEDQIWKRIELPRDWDKRRKIEIKQQEKDPDFFDIELEKIREKFWQYRLCGLWFKNNGKNTYISGSYFKYLNCCPIDIGYPSYRDTDRQFYYVWEYCVEDPRCAGLVDIERRRMGKCLGINTPIRMYDGSIKMVQDVVEGDLVMGDDGKARRAFGITMGNEQMYKIIPNEGAPFTCNESHILSLRYNKNNKHKRFGWEPGSIVNIPLRDYLKLRSEKKHLVLYRTGWGQEFKNLLPPYTSFKVECIGYGDYYGFAVDKNNLFLLADGLVIHNTYKSGSILLDRASLFRNHHGGIQSKSGIDAKQVFSKTVIAFFKKLPDFFRPVYDKSKGITPASELRFFQTTRKGRNAEAVLEGEELESWIDHGTSEPFHYDGSKLNTYIMDEFGKTMECNVWDRWNVVRYCLDQDGHWVGKALLTTTIEEMENGGENGKKIWDCSDPLNRNDNGRTASGLYRFFLPAFDTTFFDKYGIPKTEEAKEYYLKERAGLQNDPRALSSHIRKNPFDINEAFRIDGDRCLYDSMKLNYQLDSISYKQNLTTRGNFVWENGEPFTKVKFEKSWNGRFEVAYLIENPEAANAVVCRNGRYFPNNNFSFAIGCDPFKYDAVKDNRRSDCAAFVFKKNDPLNASNPYNNAFVCYYRHRAQTTALSNEDVLKMAWYYGCQVLFERNVDHWRDYFRHKACEGFLMKLPGEKDYGVYTDGMKVIHQMLADYTEAYINEHIEKVYFKRLLEEWLLFDLGETTKYDTAMAAGFTLIAARDKSYIRKIDDTKDVSNYFRMHKAI